VVRCRGSGNDKNLNRIAEERSEVDKPEKEEETEPAKGGEREVDKRKRRQTGDFLHHKGLHARGCN